jgi:hypothetical protein
MSDRERWEKITREHLGSALSVPLVASLLQWIRDEELFAAMEKCGLLTAGRGEIATVKEITESVRAILRAAVIPPDTQLGEAK